MTSLEACGDSPRPFLGSPVAGVAADEIIDATPALEEIKRRYIGNPEYSNLPRKFKTSASGHPSLDCVPSVNDVSFVGTVHPEHGPGFDLWVGGGLSTNPMLAQKLGVWIPLDEVPDAWEAVTSVFRDYGYRRLRSRARLKFLVADWGVEKFREVLETEYLERKLVDCPSPEATGPTGDHIGVHAQKDGKFYVGAAPRRRAASTAQTLTSLGDLVEKYGAAGARLTAQQKVVVLGVDEADVESTRRRPGRDQPRGPALQLASLDDGLHRHRVLQAGDRRDQAARDRPGGRAGEALPRPRHPDHRQRQRLPERLRPHPGRRHRPQGHARAWTTTASRSRASRSTSAAASAWTSAFGKKLRAHKVTSTGSTTTSPRSSATTCTTASDGESFAAWAVRADEILLRGEKALLMSARAVPFHCPYCGDENLWPHEAEGPERVPATASGNAGPACGRSS